MNNSTDRNSGLDLLRFFAASAVMIYHYGFAGMLGLPARVPGAFFGNHGVDVFFIISGFVIAFSIEQKTPVEFIRARAVRLWPAFFVCCLATLIFNATLGKIGWPSIMPRLLANLTFFPKELTGYPAADGVYWTLGIEVRFYVVIFLAAMLGLWRRHTIHFWVIVAVLNEFWWRNYELQVFGDTYFIGFFAIGMLMADFVRHRAKWIDLPVLLAAIAVTLPRQLANEAWIASHYGTSDTTILPYVYTAAAMIVVFAFVRVPVPRSVAGITRALGAISYPLYLLHPTIGVLARTIGLPSSSVLLGLALVCPVAIAAGAFVALGIEPPLRDGLRTVLTWLGRFAARNAATKVSVGLSPAAPGVVTMRPVAAVPMAINCADGACDAV